jgi:hypothetical protein
MVMLGRPGFGLGNSGGQGSAYWQRAGCACHSACDYGSCARSAGAYRVHAACWAARERRHHAHQSAAHADDYQPAHVHLTKCSANEFRASKDAYPYAGRRWLQTGIA